MFRLLIAVAAVGAVSLQAVGAVSLQDVREKTEQASQASPVDSLADARRLFFNGRYDAAAALTLEPCLSGADGLAACELRASAVLFQIKRTVGAPADKKEAVKQCAACPDLFAAFQAATAKGQDVARARIRSSPDEDATLFLLGKLSLNHVWLHIDTLGRKTGWSEYWEGRRSLDKALKLNPGHVRARVARGWIDYIVDTRVPRGTRWLLGGGNKKRGLLAVREAASVEGDFFSHAEARFALWDMQVREKDLTEAVVTARLLARDFPENQELTRFLEAHDRTGQHTSRNPSGLEAGLVRRPGGLLP